MQQEEFRDTFAEIMIDEYQDSNYVQETITSNDFDGRTRRS